MSDLCYLSAEELIKHAIKKGITFNSITPQNAINYLQYNNYYFKLSSYRKNFPKNQKNQYVNLDFAELIDLAIIDSYLRIIIMKLALNIEHFSKVYLLNILGQYDNSDATQIVNSYLKSKPAKKLEEIKKELTRSIYSPYSKDLYDKHQLPNMPVWAFIEIISFGTFIDFYQFCSQKFPLHIAPNLYYLLLSTKKIRNATAHNNCIINDLRSSKNNKKTLFYNIDFEMARKLSTIGISKQTRKTKLSNLRIYQIIACLYMHQNIVSSSGTKQAVALDLQKFKSRLFKNFNFENSPPVNSTFKLLIKIIDTWYNPNIDKSLNN